ncbi:MAG: 30S ribosome-binding factor RbfA [Acidimicrobiia bacterium]|nr:30S ribosome-binding factor RbfA [Acidimicrobiia bacterium]
MAKRARGHRNYDRGDRVGELIRRILADQLERLDDERLELVTLTGVDVDNELHTAHVYWSGFGGDDDAITEAFDEHRGVLRRSIGREARLRHTPQLVFAPDHGIRAGERIEEILRSLEAQPTDEPDDDGDDDGHERR